MHNSSKHKYLENIALDSIGVACGDIFLEMSPYLYIKISEIRKMLLFLISSVVIYL